MLVEMPVCHPNNTDDFRISCWNTYRFVRIYIIFYYLVSEVSRGNPATGFMSPYCISSLSICINDLQFTFKYIGIITIRHLVLNDPVAEL